MGCEGWGGVGMGMVWEMGDGRLEMGDGRWEVWRHDAPFMLLIAVGLHRMLFYMHVFGGAPWFFFWGVS